MEKKSLKRELNFKKVIGKPTGKNSPPCGGKGPMGRRKRNDFLRGKKEDAHHPKIPEVKGAETRGKRSEKKQSRKGKKTVDSTKGGFAGLKSKSIVVKEIPKTGIEGAGKNRKS